ncbi:claspin-like [Condylostylus longicornis]|uniref:claspin-like n=1 Tax=Condylostylus longicornis TaxID=2530218 RepID=UPI00244DCB3E|nr:claspin-like [Condylostylus longicornis]
MANIEYLNNKDDANLYGILLTFCGLICIVAAILGIKLKWFKHRLNFESSLNEFNQTNSASSTTQTETFRSLNQQYKPTPYEVGVFRKKSDNEFDLERPRDLPPIKINNSSGKKSGSPNFQQLTNNISKSISQKQSKIAKEKLKSEAVNPTVHNTRYNSSSNSKSSGSRSNSRSPKKEHHQNRHSKRNYEKSSSEKNISPLQKSKEKNSAQSFLNNKQMENKKNIKKKIKFDNIPVEKDDPNSSQIHRRPTGFTKLSQKELEELEALSEQTPVNPSKQKRRPTGFELLSKEELEELEYLASKEENTIEKKFNSIQFHDIEENEPFGTRKTGSEQKEDDYGSINNWRKNESNTKNDFKNYPGVIEQENGQLTFKITGFSDNEDDDEDLYSKLKIRTKLDEDCKIENSEEQKSSTNLKPEPQPRITLRQSKDEDAKTITAKIENVSISSPLLKATSNNLEDSNTKTENEEDSWSIVRNYRNITEEMAKHNQAIREAAKEKAARRELRNPLAYDDMNNTVSHKPKNMKDVKKKQHDNEEREKKSNQKVSLSNDQDEESEISC